MLLIKVNQILKFDLYTDDDEFPMQFSALDLGTGRPQAEQQSVTRDLLDILQLEESGNNLIHLMRQVHFEIFTFLH